MTKPSRSGVFNSHTDEKKLPENKLFFINLGMRELEQQFQVEMDVNLVKISAHELGGNGGLSCALQ